jgi:organic hydroperoxide reductase OsmC/OhrA
MSEHKAFGAWKNQGDGDFLKGRYSRDHTWTFDGGAVIAASPAPSSVRPPYSNPAHVDPEEAFVASIASCHMLTFLYLSSKGGFEVTSYEDQAVGRMMKNERGIPWVSQVELSPKVAFGGEKRPSSQEEDALHHKAHEECFIANSVKTAISVLL